MSTDNLTGTLSSTGNLNGTFGTSGGGGTSNYNDLTNKPQINGNTLEGNKTPAQLGINIPDMTNYYNKSETNTLLDGKANVSDLPDMSNYYDKSETDNLLDGKADNSDLPDMNNYYDKSETDTLLDDKVNNSSFNAASMPITSGSATNTKDYIDNINTTLSGRNNIKYYDMSVTTVANSYVSPFSAYVSENLPANLQSKTVLSAQVLTHTATNPTSVQFKDYTIYVYSKTGETFNVRVVYID